MQSTSNNASNNTSTEVDKLYQKTMDILAFNIEHMCKEKGISYSSFDSNSSCCSKTVKKITGKKSNPSLYSLAAIAAKLDVKISDLFQETYRELKTDPTICKIPKKDMEEFPLITDPSSAHMKNYLRKYQTLFYDMSADDDLIKGTLQIYADKTTAGTCSATLTLSLKNTATESNIYTGKFYVSDSLKAAYLIMSNKHNHGIFFITFATNPKFKDMKKGLAFMGLCLCADADGFPITRRILIADDNEKIEKNLDIIKGQLLMNNEKVYLTQAQAISILHIKDMPDSVRNSINRVLKNQQNTHNYIFNETNLGFTDTKEKDRYISLMRAFSEAPKTSKIARITQDIITKIFS